MEVLVPERHQRLTTTATATARRSVCRYWRAGRCNRQPCRFRHCELPPPGRAAPRRPNHQQPSVARGGAPRSNVWTRLGAAVEASKKNPAPGAAANVGSAVGDCRNCAGVGYLTRLEGHETGVTGIALPPGSNKLFSGSRDGSVKMWDCETGRCAAAVDLEGEVGCVLSDGPWVFVGIPNAVKAWNTQTAAEFGLGGPNGKVRALELGDGILFAGGPQDGAITSWKLNKSGDSFEFEPAGTLTGHRLAVVSLKVGAMRLYSGSEDSSIRAWDLKTLQCLFTLGDHTSVVTALLCWDCFLLSGSSDGTVKAWAATESGGIEAIYTCEMGHGVIALCGVHDEQERPVLVCSTDDRSVSLYDLPSFTQRGRIICREDAGAVEGGPGGLIFTGDGTGELKVWKC